MGGRLRLIQQVEPGSADDGTPGVGKGVWLLLAGIALSCTGIGAIVGIPFVIVGLAMPMARRTPARAGSAEALCEPAAPEGSRSRGVGAGTAC